MTGKFCVKCGELMDQDLIYCPICDELLVKCFINYQLMGSRRDGDNGNGNIVINSDNEKCVAKM